MTDKRINLGFRVSPERARELRMLAAQRGEKIQNMLERGLDLLVSGGSTSVPLESGTYSIAESVGNAQTISTRTGDKHWHSLLDRILRSDQRLAIQSVLAAFEGLVRESQGASAELPAEEERDIAAAAVESGDHQARIREIRQGGVAKRILVVE